MRKLAIMLWTAGLLIAAPAFRRRPRLDMARRRPRIPAGTPLDREKNFPPAIEKLEVLLKRSPTSPVLLNWLAFSHRKLKNYPLSKGFYDAALKSDPTFLPALEYQGEWFLETGDMASAKANLARLEQLCGRCHEWGDLRDAIAKAEVGK